MGYAQFDVKTIKTIPLKLKEPLDIEVRGEIFMSKKTLVDLNEKREKEGLPLFKNCRNAAAGSIRQLDSSIAKERNLEVFIYHLPNPSDYNIKTHYEALNFMKELGFKENKNNTNLKLYFYVRTNTNEVILAILKGPNTTSNINFSDHKTEKRRK